MVKAAFASSVTDQGKIAPTAGDANRAQWHWSPDIVPFSVCDSILHGFGHDSIALIGPRRSCEQGG